VAAVAVALTVGGLGSGVANAEPAPGCSSTVQIGSTAYISYQGATAASVKQFKGCGQNWAYTYVWDQFRAKHLDYSIETFIMMKGYQSDSAVVKNAREQWSSGTNTLTECTQAVGILSTGDWNDYAVTDMRC
jgi:hypothetical protein